ncbi:transcription initiation factor IIB [Sporothrix eucalyptigena]|uniref:Transcription initiation factor IIB n=1 Tax=Sporothrix eucalyptigena TaxID=1812306 RepID=A0ABP0D318_9PEZI
MPAPTTLTMDKTWIVPTTVVGVVLLAAAFSALLLRRFKKTRSFERARERDPRLSWTRFVRRWKMSSAQRLEEDELERRMLLQKALSGKMPTR